MRLLLMFTLVLGSCAEDRGNPDMNQSPLVCENKPAQLFTDSEWTVMSGGVERRFSVHLPDSYDGSSATPILLSFHGLGSNGTEQQLLDGISIEADAEGFIAVYPEGTGINQSWNGGACCGSAATNNVDDVQFVSDMLDKLEQDLCVDTSRVFATGISNGGFLSYRLACELSDRISAIAPVAATMGIEECAPARAVPLMHFHGTSDTLVPYGGLDSFGMPPVEDTVRSWAVRNGCGTDTAERTRNGDSTCIAYNDCPENVSVILCTVEGGGHTWPGGLAVPGLGKTTYDISATESMWRFFSDVRP